MLLILGLDGATLDLVEPWAADGTLPNLARLMREGTWGPLASTIPPATFPGWTTFMTGVNPGRHGIFDFTRKEPGAYRVRFVNGTYRKAPTVWNLLSSAGRRVTVLGLPGTYPPEPINGYMVSGFDTPVTLRADRSFVYPPSFAADLERAGGFPFADFQEFDVGPGWHARALTSLLEGIERKGRLAEQLLVQEPWDCLMLLLGESDTVAHHFWGHHDPASPRFDRVGAAELGDPVRKIYAALDRLIGRLIDVVPGTRVMIVSDHGFGGAGDTALYLNRWLAEQGWLAWAPRRTGATLAAAARAAAIRSIPERLQARCFRMGNGRIANRIESGVRFGGIDWSGTMAFSEELNYFPSIWLNVRGCEAAGVIPSGEYRRVCAEIIARLLEWKDPVRGSKVVRRVWQRDEVYDGPQVGLAPDLILDLATPDGYSYSCLSSRGQAGPAVERLNADALVGGKRHGMSGSHRPDGLFVLAGGGIASQRVSGTHIADMAPTILALTGLQAPAGWDGRAILCVGAADEALAEAEAAAPAPELPYDAVDEAVLRERLTQLGYLE